MSTRDRAILFMLFVGFVIMVFEVRFEHQRVLTNPHTWQSWIPLIYSGLAALACLVAMAGKKAPRTIAASVFFLGLAVGGFGLYMHTKFEPTVFLKFLRPDQRIYSQKKDSAGNPIEVYVERPVAAPLSMAGLASVGFLLTSGLFKSGRNG